MSSPAIRVRGLTKAYGRRQAVAGLSFTVERGEVFGLLGPNGAGKTTTVEILEGYRRPDGGEVEVLGLDPIGDGAALRDRIGVMLQEGGLYPGLRPLELLRLFAAYYDDPDDPERLIEVVGLGDSVGTPVRRLSGGQAQRLSLATALIGRPEVCFLDEPTAGMDPHARLATWEIVRGLRASGVTVVLTTHAMDEAEQLCDRVAIVAGGRLAAIGTPAELTRGTASGEVWIEVAEPIDGAALAASLALPEGAVRPVGECEFVLTLAIDPAAVRRLAEHLAGVGVTLLGLRSGRRSLEEAFFQITAESNRDDGAGS